MDTWYRIEQKRPQRHKCDSNNDMLENMVKSYQCNRELDCDELSKHLLLIAFEFEKSFSSFLDTEGKVLCYLMDKEVCPKLILTKNNQITDITKNIRRIQETLFKIIEGALEILGCEG